MAVERAGVADARASRRTPAARTSRGRAARAPSTPRSRCSPTSGTSCSEALEPGPVAHVARVEAQPAEALAQLGHGRGVGAAVVVEDDDGPAAGVAEVVEALERHAAGHRAVADHGDDPPVVDALQLERLGQAVGVAEDGRGVAVLDPVVLGLGPARVARQAAGLAQVVELVAPAGDDLVDVGLVAGVPQDDVAGRVEHPVHGERELDHAEVGAEVTAVGRRRRRRSGRGSRRPARRAARRTAAAGLPGCAIDSRSMQAAP